MKIITSIFFLAGFWVNAQEGIKNVYAEPVNLTKEISNKKPQARISPNITENNFKDGHSNKEDNINASKIDNPSKKMGPNRGFDYLNKNNDTIIEDIETTPNKIVEKKSSENYKVGN
ncbi:hypothetical protein [Aequorivita marina]|uniref:hypothetical protein n=1 Tax=Aequorivita marina TaxID=3073654 RepID=UPI002874E25A|nr:hypothetical protein [Aequorivita sp. S2608]MDS1298068.1 hypothetical protein [Aequorivita sp. S2608]